MRKPQEKKWDVCPRIPEDINTRLIEYHPILRQVLFNRGITDVQNANMFLNAERILHDPFLMKDMDIAVEKIDRAILDNKKIVVFGDYDADGVTATVLLVQVLERMGANAGKYIPNRFDEGYGFSMDALEEVLKEKPNLLITLSKDQNFWGFWLMIKEVLP